MKLSISAVVLAVFASAIAAPQYGRNEKLTQTYAEKPIATTTLAADIPAEFDCAGKENRGYVIGCNQDYFLCWDEVMTKASCPEGMMYNQENGQCDFNINIFECTGVRTTVAPLADEHSTLAPINFDCSKLSDGDYAYSHECQLNYVSCVGGQGIERTCPDELSFDPENRLCDRLETIEACGGSPTTAAPIAEAVKVDYECPSPSGTFALTSQLCSAVYYACEDNVATIAMCEEPMIWNDANKECALASEIPDCAFDCAGKADAAYSTGCSNNYWWCWQERATKLACPEGMMFDGERALCDVQENIFECTGVRTTTPLADAVPTMAPVDFDCAGLEDGNHAFKNGELCQEKFVSCVGGFAWEMTCPDSLMFDPE
uniref:Chitin-binding type-2 domain-containing protein n=1 Tax=Plectus sambesii TaxID=2011161 RepID=A0A914XL87_9BILA